jgi:FMN phosphatase YigB (HAD superfamily)
MIALFDIGSTLIEGPPYGPARRLTELLELGPHAAPELERVLFRTPSASPEDLALHVARAAKVDLTHALEACGALWRAQLTEAYTLPGAAEAVAALARAGIGRAYLSNIWPPFYEHFRRAFPGEEDAPQFLSFRMGLSKPDKRFFEEALRALQAPAPQVVMIGDTYRNDILPALELGMRTVWILHRPEKERESLVAVLNGTAPRPHLTLRSIAELKPELL